MANIKLTVRGSGNPSSVYLRFYSGKKLDITSKTSILVNPVQWDNNKGQYRNIDSIHNRLELNNKFTKLKAFIVDKYSSDYMAAEIIDKQWLDRTILKFFNRSEIEQSRKLPRHYIYYVDFCEWWLKEKGHEWKTGKNKFLNKRGIGHYEAFIAIWKNFQNSTNYKIKDVDSDSIGDLINFMESKGYSLNTIKRHVSRGKFFLNRAELMGISVSSNYKERVYVGKEENLIPPYLNEQEIKAIFDLDLSNDIKYDICRDYLIISCYTGLRVSDLIKNLNISNIENGYISIKTTKTGSFAKIPIHPRVSKIIKKRFGHLPPKISDTDYNLGIKEVCNKAEINEVVYGKLWDNEIKRNKKGHYEKWKLVTSHIGRRTFATMLSGKVSREVIASIGGWKDIKMVDFYNKTTAQDYANILAEKWKNETI